MYAALTLLFLSLAMFRHALTAFFAVDDFVLLEAAGTRRWPATWVQLYEERFFSGQGAFMLSTALFGTRAGPPHALTFALHWFNAWLVYRLLTRLAPREPAIGVAASAIFLLHPVAYTPLAWLAAGFNEIPTLTLTLLATHLSARFAAGGSFLGAVGAVALPFAAAGFKQHAVVAPAYVIGVAAYCGFQHQSGRCTVRLIARLSVLVLVFVAGAALFFQYVLPGVAERFTGPYERVLAPISLAHTYALLLWNSLNPVAFLRVAIGYQEALPETLTPWRLVVSLAGLIPLALAITWGSAKIRERRLAGLLAAILIAALAIPATMPGHLYEYYSYFSLPAAAGLLALVLVAIRDASARIAHRPLVLLAGALLCLVYVMFAGEWLHRSNGLVRQAETARAIDRLADTIEPAGTMYFVPPIAPAVRDTVDGLLLRTLHREKTINVEFATQTDVPDRFVPQPGVTMVGLDEVDRRGEQVYWFDQAQWKTDRNTPLFVDRDIIQRVQPTTDGLQEIQVLVSAPLPPCRIQYRVDRLRLSDSEREPLAEGAVSCPATGAPRYVALPLPNQHRSRGETYEFRLRTTADSGLQHAAVVFGSSPVPAGMFPVIVGGETPQRHDATVAYRLVLRVDK